MEPGRFSEFRGGAAGQPATSQFLVEGAGLEISWAAKARRLVEEIMAFAEAAAFVGEVIARTVVSQGARAALQRAGALIHSEGRVSRLVGGLTRTATKRAQQRNADTAKWCLFYQNEPDTLASGDTLVPYSNVQLLAPGFSSGRDLSAIPCQAGPRFDVDASIQIPGFRDSAIAYRLGNGDDEPYPGSIVRVDRWDLDDGVLLSEAIYLDQFVTNQREALDAPLHELLRPRGLRAPPSYPEHLSLREIERERNRRLPDFSVSKLANSIGIAMLVITSDGWLILPRRNREVHFDSEFEGCSVSGAVEWSGLLVEDLGSALSDHLRREAAEELLIKRDELELTALAFAREFQRGGKPQFFYLGFVHPPLQALASRWEQSPHPKREYSSIRWIELFTRTATSDRQQMASSAMAGLARLLPSDSSLKIGSHRLAPSEEARAAIFYAIAHLREHGPEALPAGW